MAAEHVIPGFDDPTCGIAVAAKRLVERGVGADGETWVHSMWLPMVVAASAKALLAGRRLVRMPHGCTDPAKLRHHWGKKRWVAPIERFLFRRADRIIATCAEEVEWIMAFEPNVKKIEVVDLRENAAAPASARRRGGVDPLRLLFVGRLHPLKGVEYLLEALHELKASQRPGSPAVKLKIVGKDEGEGAKLKSIAERGGLDAEFCGIVGEEEKSRAYEWCDALVLPTLSENFGLVVAEALERGKRVVTTDGAPAWDPSRPGGSNFDGRLSYIRGFRDGSPADRIRLLREAIADLASKP